MWAILHEAYTLLLCPVILITPFLEAVAPQQKLCIFPVEYTSRITYLIGIFIYFFFNSYEKLSFNFVKFISQALPYSEPNKIQIYLFYLVGRRNKWWILISNF